MEHFVSLEIWAVMVAAPFMIGWFLGEIHGVARIRKIVEGDQTPSAPKAIGPSPNVENPSSFVVKATAAVGIDEPVDQHAQREPVQSRRRREAFDGMPSVAELHLQAQKIRKNGMVWSDPELSANMRKTDPISARVLQHYRGSIDELARCNVELNGTALVGEDNAVGSHSDFPRFSDAAPIASGSGGTELARRREIADSAGA